MSGGASLLQRAENALLEEKASKLFSITRLLDSYLQGTFADILRQNGLSPQDMPRVDQIKILNRALAPFTDLVAESFPGVGTGYYSRELDAILTYGPARLFGEKVGISIGPDHIGRKAMHEGREMIAVGTMVRGDIMNCVHPIIRNSQVIGYIWANETVESISRQLKTHKGESTLALGLEIESIRLMIEKTLRFQSIGDDTDELPEELESKYHSRNMIGKSQPMRQVFDTIEKVAATDVSVLIQGESGTGKELVARAIHYQSRRSRKPLVPVNCAALPENLLESELFGYEKGAFTGASSRKLGRFELADGGTLFLDEIGDMPLALQGKLLRVLEEREVEHLGGTKRIPIDIRVISATNKDLREMVKKGLFREDLYYRLAVIPIYLPPLRERSGDIPLLARFFLRRLSEQYLKRFNDFSPEALTALMNYSWPGNIRELQNVLQELVIMEDGEVVTLDHLPPRIRWQQDIPLSQGLLKTKLRAQQRELEYQLIKEALAAHHGNRTHTARALGISRRTLQMKLREFADKV